MSEQVYEGKSVQEALAQAASALNVAIDDLQHEVVEEKTDDFWGLGETVFRVRAWVPGSEPEPEREPEPQPPAAAVAEPAPTETTARPVPAATEAAMPDAESGDPEPEPAAMAAPTPAGSRELAAAASADGEGIEAAAVSLLARIFDSMGFDCTAEAAAEVDGNSLQVSISGEDNQYLLDGRGRGLAALELILNHAFRHRPEVGQRKIRVDAGDFRSQRDDEIRDLAYQVAHRAKETGESQQTEPMNPYERRIVHLTLADDPQVSTRSLGSGFLKAVSVLPKRGGRR